MKHNNPSAKTKNSENQSSMIMFLKLIVGILLSVLYFFFLNYLSNILNNDCFYARPLLSKSLALISCSIFTLTTFAINMKRLFKNKKPAATIIIVAIVMFVLPICFLRVGIVADRYSIKKNNIWGNTVKEYNYDDITHIDVSVGYGIQYEITFESKKTITLFSDELVNNFFNDENLIAFDKNIEQYCKKTVTQDNAWLEKWNTRRFFETQEGFEYFDAFFKSKTNK